MFCKAANVPLLSRDLRFPLRQASTRASSVASAPAGTSTDRVNSAELFNAANPDSVVHGPALEVLEGCRAASGCSDEEDNAPPDLPLPSGMLQPVHGADPGWQGRRSAHRGAHPADEKGQRRQLLLVHHRHPKSRCQAALVRGARDGAARKDWLGPLAAWRRVLSARLERGGRAARHAGQLAGHDRWDLDRSIPRANAGEGHASHQAVFLRDDDERVRPHRVADQLRPARARAAAQAGQARGADHMLDNPSYPIDPKFSQSLHLSGESYLDLGQVAQAARARKEALDDERNRIRADRLRLRLN